MNAVDSLAEEVGVASACSALCVPRATFYRHRRGSQAGSEVGNEKTKRRAARALSRDEEQAVLTELHSARFADMAPEQVYATLLDEATYLCSIRTMYRILKREGESRERRSQREHPVYTKPELLATRPNEVWSWDITKLKGPAKWTYFHLYVVIDIFSRYVVGWMVAERETASLAKRLLSDTYDKQQVEEGQLTIHADRGVSMSSKQVAHLLVDLGVTKTHSRPYTSNDNPFSESHFKTMKYRPCFPERFESLEHAREFCRVFFAWYNGVHKHSGIGLVTPEQMHHGEAAALVEQRQQVLTAAYLAHPERFVGGAPRPPRLPEAVWINPPSPAESGDE